MISQGFSWGTLTNKQTNAVFSISQRSHAVVSWWAVDDGRRGLWPCTGLVVHLRQRTHSWLYVSVSKKSHRSSGFWRVHSPELLLPPPPPRHLTVIKGKGWRGWWLLTVNIPSGLARSGGFTHAWCLAPFLVTHPCTVSAWFSGSSVCLSVCTQLPTQYLSLFVINSLSKHIKQYELINI